MRWARYLVDGRETFGLVEGDRLADVAGDPFDGFERTRATRPLAETKLLAPVMPRTFYAAGLNYAEHVREVAESVGMAPDIPKAADIGYRAINAISGPGDPIVIPADASDQIQYEAELVAVIGREAKYLTHDNCFECVLGFTIGNDVSERSWQKEDFTLWRAKNTDSFAPMGPWIETDFDQQAARTKVRLNGREIIDFPTANMVHSVADFLVRMTRYVTLYPRDVIWMGTEGKSENMAHGDTCEIEITGIGQLRNPVIRASG
ncbi:MAG: 2-keto-4-pentenoate hydratase [Rhizobiales bacterium NRL2]|jgi:2-keto-4-pentenoate hydratase/2-oxohepta-3-ene-1,7-dioic acid hydratase in catechol pathway|nr:MAG: 2-keto-4-pentenoate hydratase [Rhizobiales bacterium NRL2]